MSDDRVPALTCKHFGKCGGCKFNIDYKEELEIKQKFVEDLFLRETEKIIPSPKIYFYRNRVDLSVNRGLLGFRERGKWWKVINIEECLLFSENMPKYLKLVRERINLEELGYDLRKKIGFLRYVVLREAKFEKSKMIIFVTTSEKTFDFSIFLDGFDSVVWEINDTLSDVSFGEIKEIYGEKYWKEKFLDKTFYFLPNSFAQTNSYAAQKLYKTVYDLVDGGKTLVDAYAGVGVFGILLAEKFEKVIGIEEVKEAVLSFEKNKEENEVKNYEMIEGKVEKVLRKIKDYDVLLLDPPRSGCHPKVLRAIRENPPKKIVYVSCNPKTQRRDYDIISDLYEITYIQPIDMFPRTDHVENIIVLERK